MAKRIVTSSTVTVIDKGWDGIVRDLREIGNSYAKVGLPADGSTRGRKSMSELIDVGFTHEFGYDPRNIPERSFMRTSFDQKSEFIAAKQQEAIDKVREGLATPRAALAELADEGVEIIKEKINTEDPSWDKLSDVTVAKKGTSKMLVETGQMINSMQSKVIMSPFVGR